MIQIDRSHLDHHTNSDQLTINDFMLLFDGVDPYEKDQHTLSVKAVWLEEQLLSAIQEDSQEPIPAFYAVNSTLSNLDIWAANTQLLRNLDHAEIAKHTLISWLRSFQGNSGCSDLIKFADWLEGEKKIPNTKRSQKKSAASRHFDRIKKAADKLGIDLHKFPEGESPTLSEHKKLKKKLRIKSNVSNGFTESQFDSGFQYGRDNGLITIIPNSK